LSLAALNIILPLKIVVFSFLFIYRDFFN